MATSRTDNLKLAIPAAGDRGWGPLMEANLRALDAAAGALAVSPREIPSASFWVNVAPGSYRKTDGSRGVLAAPATLAIASNATRAVFLNAAGVPTAAAAYPAGPHVKLATVTATASAIGSVVDDRVFIAQTADGADPTPYVQTYSTADRTMPAYAPNVRSTAFAGIDNAQAGTVYAKLADLNTLRAAYENLRAHAEATGKIVNALVQDLKAAGIIK